MPLELRVSDGDQIVATQGPLLLRVIERAATEFEDIDRMLALFDELALTHELVGMLIVVHHGAPLPAGGVVRHMASTYAHIRERGEAVFAMLGLGFWAMAAHKTVFTLNNLTGRSVPMYTDLDSAAHRLAERIPALSAADVIATYEAAMATMASSRRR